MEQAETNKKSEEKRKKIIAGIATVVFSMADEGDLIEFKKGMEHLQNQEFNINWANPNDHGSTFLIVAACNGRILVVKYLLENYKEELEVDKQDDRGVTALWAAVAGPAVVAANRVEIIKMLLENKADPDSQPYDERMHPTPLYGAAKANYFEVCELLLNFGATIDKRFRNSPSCHY